MDLDSSGLTRQRSRAILIHGPSERPKRQVRQIVSCPRDLPANAHGIGKLLLHQKSLFIVIAGPLIVVKHGNLDSGLGIKSHRGAPAGICDDLFDLGV